MQPNNHWIICGVTGCKIWQQRIWVFIKWFCKKYCNPTLLLLLTANWAHNRTCVIYLIKKYTYELYPNHAVIPTALKELKTNVFISGQTTFWGWRFKISKKKTKYMFLSTISFEEKKWGTDYLPDMLAEAAKCWQGPGWKEEGGKKIKGSKVVPQTQITYKNDLNCFINITHKQLFDHVLITIWQHFLRNNHYCSVYPENNLIGLNINWTKHNK